MSITKAQEKVLNSMKNGERLTAYKNFTRFVFNVGTKQGYIARARTVNILIEMGLLMTTQIEYGYEVTLNEQ